MSEETYPEVQEVRVRLDTQEIEELLYEKDKKVVWTHVEGPDLEYKIIIVKEAEWG